MTPEDVGFAKAVIAFVLMGGTAMISWRLWLQSRNQTRPGAPELVEAMREENAQLRADLEDRMAELENRVDFTERRLLQERPEPRLRGLTADTPV